MPTYQFRCPDGTIVERVFKISEVPASIPVPGGEGEAVRMISGGAALIFKGSGFYITDYGKDGKKDQREQATKAESKASESKGSESKPAEGGKSEASAPKTEATKSEAPKAAPSPGSSGSSE
jgi:predicted nucleic acid-binding Zn ribbon protein